MKVIVFTKDIHLLDMIRKKMQIEFINREIQFFIFSDIRKMDKNIRLKNESIDILFCDLDGIDFNDRMQKRIEKSNSIDNVVYISETYGELTRCFLNKTRGFLTKPINDDINFGDVFNFLKEHINDKIETIGYMDYGGKKKKINVKQIKYIKAIGRYSKIKYEDKTVTISKNLGNLEKKLKESNFLRVHRSYIVNVSFINKINNQEVYLSSGDKIPVGAKYYNEFLKNIIDSDGFVTKK